MSTIEQHHSGSGDNVNGHKIYVEIKSLAPADLVSPMEMVFESLRKKDRATAKIQMGVLKTLAQHDVETAALIEVISIYGGLVDTEDHGAAWGKVSRIAASAQNATVKDVCLAALLRLSCGTEREEAAKDHYLSECVHGPYTNEVYYSLYAGKAQLEATVSQLFLSEGELTGVVEGALRLGLTELALGMADLLNERFASYNARVLKVLASAHDLNPELAERHLWLCSPEIKQRLDSLTEQVIGLLDQSEGTDARLYNMACPIFETYRGHAPSALFESLEKNLLHFETAHAKTAAIFQAITGNDADIPQNQRELLAAKSNPGNRTAWCRRFLAASEHSLEDVIPFLHLATPTQISEWLSTPTPIVGVSEMERAFVELLGQSFQGAEKDDDLLERRQLSEKADLFLDVWEGDLAQIVPELVFKLAGKLTSAKLPHKALSFTMRLVPDHALWPSPFILTHLQCLLESQQYKTFDDVVSRVAEAETSMTIMSFQSVKAERMGEIDSAVEISDQMLAQSPESPFCWHRGCFLRARYLGETEQRDFQSRIPDSILKDYSPEVVRILYFLTTAGNFKRAEPRWVEWFLDDPRARSVELVNFHFGLIIGGRKRYEFDVSPELERCTAAFQFEQDGNRMIRLIVDDHQGAGEFTLKASSQLAGLLYSLPIGGSGSLGMTTYKVVERLPPYVACLHIALNIRHTHNDGSDCFAMLTIPTDTEQLVPFLEEKLGQDGFANRKQLNNVDNVPLYIRGHVLYRDNAFKAALNCWNDVEIPKSMLFNQGDETPDKLVLDAYGISYLAVTDLAQSMLDIGISFVLPAATKEELNRWVDEISDDEFMLLGVNEGGKLFRTTASDIQARDGHTLRALRKILDNASVVHPVLHDIPLEVYSIKDGIDATVYDAMQLSAANGLSWLCMDGAFAALHLSNRHPTANVQALIARAMASSSFDFEQKRHSLLLYALGAIPLPVTFSEIHCLAANPNALSGFILSKIIRNHGRQIFLNGERPLFLLDVLLNHLNSHYHTGSSYKALRPSYTPWCTYSKHVFNHGMRLFLDAYKEGTAEYRLAVAIYRMRVMCGFHQSFFEFVVRYFIEFAQGHFMDIAAVDAHLQSLANNRPGDHE